MLRLKRRILITAASVSLAGMAAWAQDVPPAGARSGRGGRGGPPPEKPVSEEYLLLGSSTRGAGEPMVAVDPTDPRHIIAVAMGNLQILPGYKAPVTAGMTDKYHEVADSTITWLGVSHDGGVTWKVGELPILSGKLTRCPDSFVGVTKTGVFIAGCEPRESEGEFYGMSAVVVSTDHGDTWSKTAPIVSSYQKPPFAAGLKPRIGGNSPWDRPFLYFDDQTGAVYSSSSGGETNIDTGATDKFRTQSYVTVSHDSGHTFGTVYATDSPDWPQQGRASVAAGHGILAEIYIASKAPSSENAACPCEVFGVSHDEGKTFERHVMKHITIPPGGGGRGGGPGGGPGVSNLIADPTTAGRYSVMRTVAAPSPHYEVATSNDGGTTWGDFAPVPGTSGASSVTKPWIGYSREGVLGLMWRAVYPDRTYDIWASISRDSGKTFSEALRISHTKSPATDYYRNGGNFGDDIQDLSMDKDNMHLVWGDYRSGFLGVWYARVALSSFKMP
jgi:hypothetical protein